MKKLLVLLSVIIGSFGSIEAQDLKIGYTNVEYILSLMPEAKEIESNYKSFESQLQNQLKAKVQEYQTKGAEYQKNAATMTEIVRADKEAELLSLQERIQKFEQEAQASLTKKQASLFKPVLEKIQGAIKEISEANGYTHVFSAGSPGVDILLYAREQDDVSNLVLKQLGVTPPAGK